MDYTISVRYKIMNRTVDFMKNEEIMYNVLTGVTGDRPGRRFHFKSNHVYIRLTFGLHTGRWGRWGLAVGMETFSKQNLLLNVIVPFLFINLIILTFFNFFLHDVNVVFGSAIWWRIGTVGPSAFIRNCFKLSRL